MTLLMMLPLHGLAVDRGRQVVVKLTDRREFKARVVGIDTLSDIAVLKIDAPAPLQKMDPLTRGDLFHQMQAAALRRLQAEGLLPLSQQSLFVLASLAYHGYEGVALNHDEKARLQADLGDKNFMILPNHGLLTAFGGIADAFLGMFVLQRACEIQVMAQSGGAELIHIPQQILDGARAMIAGATSWPTGILRMCTFRICSRPRMSGSVT